MTKPTCFRPVFALFLAVVMLCSMLPLEASAAKSAEIKEEINELKKENAVIQAEIDAIRTKYDANASEMRELVAKKDAIDQEIALLHTQIENLNNQTAAYSQMIADSQDELDIQQQYLDELNQKHKERIRAMEEEGEISYWEVIFEANNFMDLLDRVNMVQEIAASDQRRLAEIEDAARELEEIMQTMDEEKASLQTATEELAVSQTVLEERRTESDDVLRQLVVKQDEFQVLLDESEALQDELMKELGKKQRELQQAQYEERLAKLALQGQNPPSNATWRIPTSNYRITSAFGMRVHPILGYKRMHNGIDMSCPVGTPIYATRAGTVTAASYQEGGAGNYVSISHGDGFASVYMHMTHYIVSPGQTVAAGQVIGYVGNTGLSTGPHLHFGISYAGTYVNPLAYI